MEYRRPARLDDELTITCEPRGDRAAMRYLQRIHRAPEGDLLVEAESGSYAWTHGRCGRRDCRIFSLTFWSLCE